MWTKNNSFSYHVFIANIKSLLCTLKGAFSPLSCPFCKETLVKAGISWHQMCSLAQQCFNIPSNWFLSCCSAGGPLSMAIPGSAQPCQSWLAWGREEDEPVMASIGSKSWPVGDLKPAALWRTREVSLDIPCHCLSLRVDSGAEWISIS